MPVATQVLEMAESSSEAKKALLREVGPYLEQTRMRAFGHDVLVAVYDRSGKQTRGGLYLPQTAEEDKFQGKVGLILSMGPLCSGPEFQAWFGDEPPQVGDWIGFNVRDTFALTLGSTACRVVEWKYLRFATDVPDLAA